MTHKLEEVVVDDKKIARMHDQQQEGTHVDQMGYYGNIWVRSHFLAEAGHTNGGGHTHNFDHVTLLAVGEILVEVEGKEHRRHHLGIREGGDQGQHDCHDLYPYPG